MTILVVGASGGIVGLISVWLTSTYTLGHRGLQFRLISLNCRYEISVVWLLQVSFRLGLRESIAGVLGHACMSLLARLSLALRYDRPYIFHIRCNLVVIVHI